jgi:hypothetical protein
MDFERADRDAERSGKKNRKKFFHFAPCVC